MNKQFKNIDDLFRSELGGSATPAPSSIKENIDSALDFNKKRSGFLWSGLYAIIGIGTMVAFIFTTSQSNERQDDHLHASTKTRLMNSSSIEQESTPLNQPVDLSADNSSNTVSPRQNISIHHSSLSPFVNPNQADEKPKKSTIRREEDTNHVKKEDSLLASQRTYSGGISRINDETETPETYTSAEDQSQTTEDLNQLEINAKDESSNENLLSNGSTETRANETSDPKDNLPAVEPTIDIQPKPDDDFKHWMIHLTGGPNLVRSAYTAKNQNDKTTFDNATSDKIGSQVNFDFMYGLRKGLSFGSGIGLSNFNENYSFETKFVTLDSVKNIEYIYDDTSEIIIDSVISYTYEEILNKTDHIGLNKASYVQVPIHLGAQLIFGKLQVDIYSSIRFNFLTRSSGGYLIQNQFIEYGQGNSIYKSFYIDLILGTRINYKVYKSLYATGSVQYRPVLGSVYTTTTFNKSFDYIHLGLGLSLRF